MDVYGMPMRLGKYHPQATEAERRALLRAVAGIASDAAAIIPESMQIEFIESKGFADQPFRNFGEYLDDQIATFVLGQTLTTRDGGSLGQAKVHNEIRLDLAEDDAFELGITITRDLLAPFVAFNFGADAKVPRCEFRVPKPEQATVVATALSLLVPLGLEVSQDDVRAKIGMPTPAPGAALLKPAGMPAVPARDVRAADVPLPGEVPQLSLDAPHPVAAPLTLPAPAGHRDIALARFDAFGFDLDPDWQADTGPMLDAIMGAARTSTSFDEFRSTLEALYGSHSTAAFADPVAALPKGQETGTVTEHD